MPKNITTGEYVIRLKTDEDIKNNEYGGSVYFTVENYRKPEYQLIATAEKIDAIRGDKLKINIRGEYYSGQPLNNVSINYKVFLNSTYNPEFYSPDYSEHYGGWYGDNVEEGTVNLDKNGNGTLTLSTGNFDFKGENKLIYVDFKYKDPTGNPASSGVNIFTRAGNISIYRGGSYIAKTNEMINLPILVKPNKDNANLSQKIKINVIRKWWEKKYITGRKYPTYDQRSETIGDYNIESDSSGNTSLGFTPLSEGSYELKTELNDDQRNPIIKTFHLWVSDSYGNNTWSQPYSDSSIKLSLNKKNFEPEETIKINLTSEIPSRDVFLSFERDYLERYKIIRIDDKQKSIEEKLLPDDIPNVFASIRSFTGEEYESDSENILINTDVKKIIYKISTDKEKYAPGDQVTVNVLSTDINGRPVKSNLALWAVDKAIYALSDKNYGNILDHFWYERRNDTQTAHSLEGITIYSSAEKGGCFLPDTQILMADGSFKLIKDIKVGDKVLTKVNDISNKLIKTNVSAVHQVKESGYLIINGNFKVTADHILFINNKWTMAGLAKIGDNLLDKNGQNIKINSLEYSNLKTTVYNLTTDKYHTFFANNFYVHNQKGGGGRTNMADTAYWNLSVNTDDNGQAQVSFKLPDNLTTWVIAAIGSNPETKVGEGSVEVKVSKDLVIRPVLPNVLSSGDKIKVAAIVNNFSPKDINATVSVTTNAGKISSPVSQKIKINSGEFEEVNWDLTVDQGDKATDFKFTVVDEGGNVDSVTQKINIRSLGYWQQNSEFKKDNLRFSLNKINGLDLDKSKIELTLGSNLLGSLPSAMNYLINYGYGCVEQTTSSLMSKLIAKKYSNIFYEALKNQTNKTTIEDSLDKLKNMQNNSGGWSWWKDSETNPFVTAYVFMALNQSKDLGYKIDEDVYQVAKDYLTSNLESKETLNKIMASFALSFDGGKNTITQNLDQLENDLLSIAVITNLKSGLSDSSQNGLDLLMSRMQKSDIGNFWAASSPERFGSIEASTALAVQALIKSGKYTNEATDAVNYLIKSRTSDYWGNTFATLQSILAITEFNQLQSVDKTNLTYSINQNKKSLKTGTFIGSNSKPISLDIIPSTSDDQILEISKNGEGNLFANLYQKLWIKSDIGAKFNDKVEVTKTITNAQDGSYNLIPGDLALVTITFKFNQDSQDLKNGYAVIEDHLPSGLIPVNFRMLNEYDEEESYSDNYYYTEYLTDGVIIPFYLRNNKNTFTYKARVINEGTFSNPPVFFSMMYRPGIWGRSDFSSINIGKERIISIPSKNIFQKYQTLWIVLISSIFGVGSFIFVKHVLKKRQANKM